MTKEKEEVLHDQWATTGAPNFESALALAASIYENLEKKAKKDLWFLVVDRAGACFFIGSGEIFPTNEEAPAPMGFIVMKDDIINFLAEEPAEEEDDVEEDEDEEVEEEEEDAEEEEDGAEEDDKDTPAEEDEDSIV